MTDFTMEKDADGVAIVTWDCPGKSMNVMSGEALIELSDLIDAALADEGVKGIVITSGKKDFAGGMDLNVLADMKTAAGDNPAQGLFDGIMQMHGLLRKIELAGMDFKTKKGGKPIAAALPGTAVGIGLELPLSTHRIFAAENPKAKIGLPEIMVGIFPGAGGTTRLVRKLGAMGAAPFLLQGKLVDPKKAKGAGIIDDVVGDPVAAAREWVLNAKDADLVKPWDAKGYKMPGGAPYHPAGFPTFVGASAMVNANTNGAFPAAKALLSAVYEGAMVPFDTALKIEARWFTHILMNPSSAAMIRSLFLNKEALEKGAVRPKGIPDQSVKKLGVLGAGMMGAGIAYSTATRGIEVVLKDVSVENAEKGKSYSDKLLAKKVSRDRMTEEQKAEILGRIKATDNADDLDGCDLVIEAVFEDSDLKAKVTQEAEPKLKPYGIFASNTSTIPITQLAEASNAPENFIGLHFFSPVDKMQLVEIIVGKNTSDDTLARAFDYVQQIGKIPIVVNDSRGFFTSRVFGTFVNEGICMLGEGIHPASIENAGVLSGMPVGPLAISDEVSLTLMRHIRDQSKKDTEAAGNTWRPHPAEAVIDQMLDQHARRGKAAGAGFYEYPANGKKYLWPELETQFVDAGKARSVALQDLKDRILFIQAIETVRCLEEGVLRTIEDANVGSIFGIGYAPWTGGAIQFINQYGVRAFTERARELAQQHGERFAPPKLLLDQAEANTPFA